MLNCGLRIPPAAGSGSGTNDNPLGTNRVYVYCGDEFSPNAWWEGLEAGRVFVTNGPLLRPMVEGQPPGYVFHLDGGEPLTLEIGLESGDARAGRVLADHQERRGRSTKCGSTDWTNAEGQAAAGRRSMTAAGSWCGRSRTTEDYQFASSGPYYVEKAGQPRVSRASVQFFLDWIDAAEARIRELPGRRRRRCARSC